MFAFLFVYCIHNHNFFSMDTVNYQAKVQALLGYLSEHNYSDSYVRSFRSESVRMLDYLSGHASLDGYFQGYTERCGLKQTPQKSCAFRLIRSYIECGRLPSRRHPLRGTMPCHEMLPEDIRGHLDSYLSSCGDRWAPSTAKKIRQHIRYFKSFFRSQKSHSRFPSVIGKSFESFHDHHILKKSPPQRMS